MPDEAPAGLGASVQSSARDVRRAALQRPQQGDQAGLVLISEVRPEPRVVEVGHVEKRRGRPLWKYGARPVKHRSYLMTFPEKQRNQFLKGGDMRPRSTWRAGFASLK
jgi:hypothetical protein